MVMTIGRLAAPSYYLQTQVSHKTTDGNPAPGLEPDGTWWNPAGLLDIPDDGAIDRRTLECLHQGFAPDGTTRLTSNAGSPHRNPGWSLVFSPDKSVSALWAIAEPSLRRHIEDAHSEAVNTAMLEISRFYGSVPFHRRGFAQARISADFMAAMFRHGANRDGEPLIHTHCLVFNLARRRIDGRYCALSTWRGAEFTLLSGAIYRNALAWNLQTRIGAFAEPCGSDGQFFRLAGIPRDVTAFWSTRMARIQEASRGRLRELPQWAIPSQNPHNDRSPEARHRRWQAEFDATGAHRKGVIALATGWAPDSHRDRLQALPRIIDALPGELARTRTRLTFADLAARVEQVTTGLLDRKGVEAAITQVMKHPDLVPSRSASMMADMPDNPVNFSFTPRSMPGVLDNIDDISGYLARSPAIPMTSGSIAAGIRSLHRAILPVDGRQTGSFLANQQAAAIRRVAASGRLAVIEAIPGPERTILLKILTGLHSLTASSVEVTTSAPSALCPLGDACGIRLSGLEQTLKKKTTISLLLVDRAESLSAIELHRLLLTAQHREARIIFLVEPGLRSEPFDRVRNNAPVIAIGPSVRQQPDSSDIPNPAEVLSSRLPTTTVIRTPVHNDPTAITSGHTIAADQRRGVLPWQAQAAEAFRTGNAAVGLARYAEHGQVHVREDLEACLTVLVEDWIKFCQERPGRTALAIACTQTEVSVLTWMLRQRHLGAASQPRRCRVPIYPVSSRKRQAYIDVAVGDLICLNVSFSNRHITLPAGTILTVDNVWSVPGLKETRIHFMARTGDGRVVSFSDDEIRNARGWLGLRHGYAHLADQVRNLVAERALLLADGNMKRGQITEATRIHRQRLDIYINRTQVTQQMQIRNSGSGEHHDNAIQAFLAECWSREQPPPVDITAAPPADRRLLPVPYRVRPEYWVAAHDSGSGVLKAVGKDIRRARRDLRYGETVRALAAARTRVMNDQGKLLSLYEKDGKAILASTPFLQTLDRHRILVRDTRRLLERSGLSLAFLKEKGGISLRDIQAFQRQYRKALRLSNIGRNAAMPDVNRTIVLSPDTAVIEARARYRQLQENWNRFLEHNGPDEAIYTPGFTDLVTQVTALAENPHLDHELRRALGNLLQQFSHAEVTRDHLKRLFQDLDHNRQILNELENQTSQLQVRLFETRGAETWLTDIERLLASGDNILKNEEQYRVHLEKLGSGPRDVARVMARLDAIRRSVPAIRQAPDLTHSHHIGLT